MPEPRAQRTLVKSPPELWAEVSDAGMLARHLGEFGEIRITRLEAETTVVWEGDRARGTVELEPSGWGTKVTLTAEAVAIETEAEPDPEPEPVAALEPEPVEPEPKVGFFARLFRRRTRAVVAEPTDLSAPDSRCQAPSVEVTEIFEVEPEPEPFDEAQVEAVLVGVLDDLGSAHHRPFSRG